jgi:hypothetical protein
LPTVSHLFLTKSFRSTNRHFSQVDDENYSEEDLNLDDSEDVRSSASEDDGQ